MEGLVLEEPVQDIPEAAVVEMLQAFAVGCTVRYDSCGDLDLLHTMCAVSSVNFKKHEGIEHCDRILCVLGHSSCSWPFTSLFRLVEDRCSD